MTLDGARGRLRGPDDAEVPFAPKPFDLLMVLVRNVEHTMSNDTLLDAAGDDSLVRRISAAAIEAAVVDQLRALLQQPEIIVGTWLAARAGVPDLTEAEVSRSLGELGPLWGQLFPAEQARIVHLLVERVVVSPTGADIQLRVEGLASLVRDLGTRGAPLLGVAA